MALYFAPASTRPQVHSFSNVASVVINHELGYKPMVQVIVNGEIVNATVTHTSSNEVRISFQNSISGEIILR